MKFKNWRKIFWANSGDHGTWAGIKPNPKLWGEDWYMRRRRGPRQFTRLSDHRLVKRIVRAESRRLTKDLAIVHARRIVIDTGI